MAETLLKSYHAVDLSNLDINVIVEALGLLAESTKQTKNTREWAVDLANELRLLIPAEMRGVLPTS